MPADHLKCQGDGAKGADEKKCPSNRFALVFGEAIGQQESKASAEGRPSAGDQDKFRKADSSFPHDESSTGYDNVAYNPLAKNRATRVPDRDDSGVRTEPRHARFRLAKGKIKPKRCFSAALPRSACHLM